ncbi:OmpW/AlkL family protein [Piscinibacter sp.]|uniref:OmpW/AlkL family protein n=1 Tax=Piscinibacter sp. TaxID=1903157 RepID=UPI0039E71DFB
MSKTFQRSALVLALAGGLAAPMLAQAQDFKAGDVLARVRAVNIDPANKDSIAITNVSVSDKTIPEVDFTYFLSPNLAAELILTYPQKHDVSSSAHGGKIGTLKHLPPTLTLQYHFTDFGAFKPYVGAGLNYTRFSSVNLPAGFSIDKNSVGLALQAGLDYALDSRWSINFDLKKVQIRTDLKAGGTGLGKIKVDPLLIGVGVGYRF